MPHMLVAQVMARKPGHDRRKRDRKTSGRFGLIAMREDRQSAQLRRTSLSEWHAKDTQGQCFRRTNYSCCHSLLENLSDSVVSSIAKWISGALKWAERMPTASTVFT